MIFFLQFGYLLLGLTASAWSPCASPLMDFSTFAQLMLSWTAASSLIITQIKTFHHPVVFLFWHSLNFTGPQVLAGKLITFFLLLSDKVNTDASSGSVPDCLAVWLPNVSVWLASIFFLKKGRVQPEGWTVSLPSVSPSLSFHSLPLLRQ